MNGERKGESLEHGMGAGVGGEGLRPTARGCCKDKPLPLILEIIPTYYK